MRRSWIDVFVQWGTTRRVPWWAFVGLYAVINAIAMNALRWIDGSLPTGEFTVHTGDFLYGVIPLVAYGVLTGAAHRAVDRFRPAFGADSNEEEVRQRLTTLPARMAAIVGIVGLGLGAIAFLSDPAIVDRFDDSPVTLAYALVFGVMVNVAMGLTLIVRIARIIRTVSLTHRAAGAVDLLHPEPAHAFASLTAISGASVILIVSFSIATDPTTFTNPVWAGLSVAIGVISAFAFFLPLIEMRRRLAAARTRLIEHTTTLIDEATTAIEEAFTERAMDRIGPLKTSRDVFESQLERVERASTWPWDPGTLRGFASSLLLPVLLWFVTNVLGNWLGI